MAGKREKLARREKEDEAYDLSDWKKLPIGSALRRIIEQMDKKQGVIKVDNEATYDGRGIDLNALVSCLHILANPLHPENRWSCLVEMVKYDDEAYLRLVPSIPLEVKKRWEATGRPPRQTAITDIREMISTILGGTGITRGGSGKAGRNNPYAPGTKYHTVYEMASDWIPFRELLSRIRDELCEGNDGNARSLLNLVAKRNGRSHLLKRTATNGVKMVRAVPGPELVSATSP